MHNSARSKSTYNVRLSHFTDETSGGLTSSTSGTCEDSLGEEEDEEDAKEEDIGKYPLLRLKQQNNGESSAFAKCYLWFESIHGEHLPIVGITQCQLTTP